MFARELEAMVKSVEREEHRVFTDATRAQLEQLVANAGTEVVDLVDDDRSGYVEWVEFHRHRAAIQAKQDKIRNYAKVLLYQDVKERPARKPRCSILTRVDAAQPSRKLASSAHLNLAVSDFRSAYLGTGVEVGASKLLL